MSDLEIIVTGVYVVHDNRGIQDHVNGEHDRKVNLHNQGKHVRLKLQCKQCEYYPQGSQPLMIPILEKHYESCCSVSL